MRPSPNRLILISKDDVAIAREINEILKDGFWDDPSEPGHAENRKKWKSLYRSITRAFRSTK